MQMSYSDLLAAAVAASFDVADGIRLGLVRRGINRLMDTLVFRAEKNNSVMALSKLAGPSHGGTHT
jgi:hypothetical protein